MGRVRRETYAGMYARLPYALTQGDVEFPYLMLQAVIFSVIVYAMIGFQWTAGEPADARAAGICTAITRPHLALQCCSCSSNQRLCSSAGCRTCCWPTEHTVGQSACSLLGLDSFL